MGNAVLLQEAGEVLRLLHARGSHQNRLPGGMPLHEVLHHGGVFGIRRAKDQIGVVDPNHVSVRGNGNHTEVVDLIELGRLGHGRAGHATELVVQAEEVLQRDGGERLILSLDLDAFLGLDRLVQALVVATPSKNSTGVLVDDDDLAVDDHVVAVVLEQFLRANRVVQETHERGVDRVVEVVDADLILDLVDGLLQNAHGALLLIDLVVLVALEESGDAGEFRVPRRRLVSRAADDQRGACLVDKDRVDLVDDGEVVSALDHLRARPRHVVAQVVEPELIVRAIGDVGAIGGPTS